MLKPLVQGDYFDSEIGSFYDCHPYPSDPLIKGPPQELPWYFSLDSVYSMLTGTTFTKRDGSQKLRILDAGCGTGVTTNCLAFLNPGAEVLAIDISLVALDIAIQRLNQSGAIKHTKVNFERKSLFEIQEKNSFDYVNSMGVLQHLNDSCEGLNALSSVMKPGSIIHLSLYSEKGRSSIHRVQKFFLLTGISSEKNVGLARELFRCLPEENQIRVDFERNHAFDCSSDNEFIDTYFHPNEKNHSVESLFELIDSSDLEFLSFSDQNMWSLDRLLEGDLLQMAKQMSKLDQWKLIEELDPNISNFDFFLSKGTLEICK